MDVGSPVGTDVGMMVGAKEIVGSGVGADVGALDGIGVGTPVGVWEQALSS